MLNSADWELYLFCGKDLDLRVLNLNLWHLISFRYRGSRTNRLDLSKVWSLSLDIILRWDHYRLWMICDECRVALQTKETALRKLIESE